MLSAAGPDGVAQANLSANGFDASMIAGLVNRGLATLMTEKVQASGKPSAVAIVRITEPGRRALATEDRESQQETAKVRMGRKSYFVAFGSELVGTSCLGNNFSLVGDTA
jgi:hypothetical protein